MKRIILILLTFIGTSYANFNLEWEVDVETFINSGYPTGYWEVDDYGMMEDEKVILYIQPSYEITIEPMDDTDFIDNPFLVGASNTDCVEFEVLTFDIKKKSYYR